MTDVDQVQTRKSPETSPWTEERLQQLKKLYTDPRIEWSFSEIAAKLGGGLSRNACIGKAHRLGLERRSGGLKPPQPDPITRRVRSQGVGASVQKINAAKAAPKAPAIKPEPFVMASTDIVPLNRTIFDLQENECRFVYGDEPAEMTFCGHSKMKGSSYCVSHHRLCMAGIPQRRGGPHPGEFGKAKGGVFGRTA